ncbi:DNA repair protein RecO [Phormidium tenue FACHB-886]|nr:DNA repair protein RecO [Phormidium tenue FACHB-886]
MSGTYKALGINLKSTPLGESDRLLTILTEEFGLIRVVAPGSRKHKSSLGGRTGLFVVNHLLIAKGKSLDKITQAESLESYPRLSQDLGKLTASQYLAELALCQALSDQPQHELFCLLREHLSRIEQLSIDWTLPCLTHATFHLLALAGVAPEVQRCCLTRQPITPNFQDPDWRIGFSTMAGGIFRLSQLDRLMADYATLRKPAAAHPDAEADSPTRSLRTPPELYVQLDALALSYLQQLAMPALPEVFPTNASGSTKAWLAIERILRQYAQYHFDRPIRSAALIDACFMDTPSLVSYDATV